MLFWYVLLLPFLLTDILLLIRDIFSKNISRRIPKEICLDTYGFLFPLRDNESASSLVVVISGVPQVYKITTAVKYDKKRDLFCLKSEWRNIG